MGNIQSMDLGNGIRLHVLKTTKFKTATLNLYIHNNLNRDASLNALLPAVLKSASNNFKTPVEISQYLENMYGAVFEADIVKKGEIQSILFYLQFISNEYAKGDNQLLKAIDLLRDIILNPIVIENGFKSEYVNIEKDKLKELIKSRVNDKVQYTVERCIETVCKDEPFSIYKYGNEKDIDSINEKNLYEHYKKVIYGCPIDIFLAGDYSIDDIAPTIMEKFKITNRNPFELNNLNINGDVLYKKTVKEKMDINQGKLCLGYRTGIKSISDSYPALSVYTSILGGGLHSKLFRNLREKEGLAYYVYSGLEKFKGLMIINSGIDTNKYDKAIDVIEKQVTEMKNGSISSQEMDASIKSLKNNLISIKDNVPLMIDYYLGGLLYGRVFSPEEMIDLIQKVDIKQIIKLGQDIKLDTIYFLSSNE